MAGFMRSMDRFGRLCQVGNLKDVEDAVKSGADVNTRDLFGWTGLMMALHHEHPAVATMLVQNPAVDVNVAGENGDCALHIASMNDKMGDCLALILAREDLSLTTVNSQDEDGSTPLMVAILHRATRCMEVLLSDDRTDPNIRDYGIFRSKGVMPVMLAAKKNFVPELELLLADARVDLLTRDNYRRGEEEITRYVAELSEEVSGVLEEELDNKDSELHRLQGVWFGVPSGSGNVTRFGGDKDDAVGERILGELNKYWRMLALQGRTLEEAARAPCDGGPFGDWKCSCGSANGHPELALLVQEERERRKAALPSSSEQD